MNNKIGLCLALLFVMLKSPSGFAVDPEESDFTFLSRPSGVQMDAPSIYKLLNPEGCETASRKQKKQKREQAETLNLTPLNSQETPPDTPPRTRTRTRSQMMKTPRKASDPLLQLGAFGEESQPPPLPQPPREFPGAPPTHSTREAYDRAMTSSPYGNPKFFQDHTRTPIEQYRPFSREQRALILLYNLIKNRGHLRSDYHPQIDSEAAEALAEMNLKETHLDLRLPSDLIEDDYHQAFLSLTDHQITFIKNQLKIDPFNFEVIQEWLRSNHDPNRDGAQVDHIIARSGLGSNDLRNAAVCSATLNREKSDLKTPLTETYSNHKRRIR